MPIVVRRINLGKWRDYAKCKHGKNKLLSLFGYPKYNAPADAITGCLKTKNNELSIWIVDNKEDIPYALLAMATGTQQDSLGKIDYVTFESDELIKAGIQFEQSIEDAGTAIPVLQQFHNDIKNVDYYCLGKIQDMIVSKINSNSEQNVIKEDLWKWIEKAIDGKLINFDLLTEKYRQDITKRFAEKTFEFNNEAKLEELAIKKRDK